MNDCKVDMAFAMTPGAHSLMKIVKIQPSVNNEYIHITQTDIADINYKLLKN